MPTVDVPGVGTLNWLDGLVLVGLLLALVEGVRTGFVRGTLSLGGLVVTYLAAMVGYRLIAAFITDLLPNVPRGFVNLGAFFLIVFVVQALYWAVAERLLHGLRRLFGRVRLFVAADRVLGLGPGLVRGLLLAMLLLLPFALTPLAPPLTSALAESTLASRLTDAASVAVPEIEQRLGRDLTEGLPALTLNPPTPNDGRPLTLGPLGVLEPDPAAEQRMLELVNEERVRAGLQPLAVDPDLREVARAHSREMFELSYFSHTSPRTGSPFDRMRRAGITFLVAGENLAYAPNVQVAHRGLMDSPGHRANILRVQFGRLGIGAIRSQLQGTMFTQKFRN